MKTHASPIMQALLERCNAAGLQVYEDAYRNGGDWVLICPEHADFQTRHVVFFNVYNHFFMGVTPDGEHFTSRNARAGTPWFDALAEFLRFDEVAS